MTRSAADIRYLRQLGERVIECRTRAGMTRAELAAAAGIPTTAVGAFERGDDPSKVLRLVWLASALDIPLADLLPGSRTVRPPSRG